MVADIPGLIEGASEGAGLGHLFLRHLARTRVLLHLVDVSTPDPDADPVEQAVIDARAIVEELRRYDPELADKPRWLVLNKLDMVADPGTPSSASSSSTTGPARCSASPACRAKARRT